MPYNFSVVAIQQLIIMYAVPDQDKMSEKNNT
jgi:hypothetical protein